ncbi:ATP-dependent helicase, partial [Peribacillus simplex]
IIPNCQKNGIPLEEICILVKDKYVVEDLRAIMEEKGIPHYIPKFEFSKSKVVIWLKECATWLVNDHSSSFSEIFDFWIKLLEGHIGIISETQKMLERKKFYNTLKTSKKHRYSLCDWIRFIEVRLNLNNILVHFDKYPEEIVYYERFSEFTIGRYKDYSVKQFSLIGKSENQVAISTRHSSKGLEFEVVILLGMEQKVFPDYRILKNEEKLNEDRRVFYVCITRAKRECYLLMSKNYTKETSKGTFTFKHKPSMYWNELQQACKDKQLAYFIC